MKKIPLIIFFLLIGVCLNISAQIYVNPLAGSTILQSTTYYLGDYLGKNSADLIFDFEIGGNGAPQWAEVRVGQDQANVDNWAGGQAAWYYYSNNYGDKRAYRDIKGIPLTATGIWYAVGRAQANYGEPYSYAIRYWANSTVFNTDETRLECPQFTVLSLENPTPTPTTNISANGLTLNWGRFHSYAVMVVRYPAGASISQPVNGTTYATGTNLNGTVLIGNNSGGMRNATTLTDAGLVSSTAYDYYIYTENFGYYSSGVKITAATAPAANDYLRSKATGNWDAIAWEASNDGIKWIATSQTPTPNYRVKIGTGTTVTANNIPGSMLGLTVEAGGKLIIPTESTIVIGANPDGGLVMEHSGTTAPEIVLNGGSIANGGSFQLKYTFPDENSWYMIGFPTSVTSILNSGGTTAVYDTDYGAYSYSITNREANVSGWVAAVATPLSAGSYAVWGVGTLTFVMGQPDVTYFSTSASHAVAFNASVAHECNRGWNYFAQPIGVTATAALSTGQFLYLYNSATDTYSTSASGTSPAIIPFSGYFVKVAGAGTLPINASNPFTAPSIIATTNSIERLDLRLGDSTSPTLTQVFLRNEATAAYDALYDAPYGGTMFTTTPQLYTLIGNEQMAINSLPSSSSINVGFRVPNTNENLLSWELFDTTSSFTLIDHFENDVEIDMSTISSYVFTPTTAGVVNNRFRIVTSPGATTDTRNPSASDDVKVVGTQGMANVLNLPVGSRLTIYDTLGRQMQQATTTASEWRSNPLKSGVYLMHIVSHGLTSTRKFVVQ